MTGFIYPTVVAWTWGGGFLTGLGFSDFAGSGVVHLTGGISGLCGAAICGPRFGKYEEYPPKLIEAAKSIIRTESMKS